MASIKDERYEFIDNMIKNVKDIPINNVIGDYIHLVPRGRHHMGLCPFHKDKRLGSFIVTPDKGLWKCFACCDDNAGDGIKFASLFTNKNYLESAFDVALRHGVTDVIWIAAQKRTSYNKDFLNYSDVFDYIYSDPKPKSYCAYDKNRI